MINIFDPNLYPKTVTIVGCGGTGTQIARSAARILYDMKARRMHTPQLVLIDGDTVEMKNVGRQLYTAADVGQPKAHVLMRRFNSALGLNSVGIAEPLNAEKHFERYSGGIVIGAVDNHLARQELSRVENAVWIDCGNHHAAGQVSIGNTDDRELMQRHLNGRDGKYAYLPNAALLFPQLLEPESEVPQTVQPVSCAELVEEGIQHLLVNDWVAVVAAQYLYKLLHRQPITSFLSYISSDGIGIRSVPICREELEAFLNVL
jgi:PRTRC genetic system ThiF family protein